MTITKMLKKRIKSVAYAVRGVQDIIRTQPNVQVHLSVAVVIIILGYLLNISSTEWSIICLTMGFVIAAEAMNTAVEYLTDLASPGFHILARKAKDAAAGAVLIAAVFAIIVGLFIFVPKIMLILP